MCGQRLFCIGSWATPPAAKARNFGLLFLVHAAQVLKSTSMVALLVVTRGWVAAVYLGSDLFVLLVSKAMRRDFLVWLPNAKVPLSVLVRFGIKVVCDSTACAQHRIPVDLGAYTTHSVPP